MKRLLIVALTMSLGSAVYAQPNTTATNENVIHALNRLTFGPTPGEIDRVKAMGLQAFVEEQLNPGSIPESPAVLSIKSPNQNARTEELIQQFRSFQQARQQAKKSAAANAKVNEDSAAEDKQKNPAAAKLADYFRKLNQTYTAEKLTKDVESPRQLEQVMTEFWFNHFNVCITKGLDRVLVGPYENQAIRPYALGKFRDLLGSTSHHPAMLFYLDNWENTAPKSEGSRGRFKGLNENYARELMELHTLGVDGGYSQKDVVELARILTGLTIAGRQQGRQLEPVGTMGAYFAPNRHDFGDKVLMGRRIAGKGEGEIEEALDMLARHPSTAHHISYQLAQYFLADQPPASLVDKMAARFTSSDGDIKAVLRELFYSSEFWDPQYRSAKYKTPLRYAVSTLRATDAHPQNYDIISQFLKTQGEPLYGCLTPDGYKNTKDAWLNPDNFLNRLNFATAVGSGNMRAVLPQAPEYRQLGATISGSKFSAKTVAVVAKAPAPLKSAVVLGSPEFMRY